MKKTLLIATAALTGFGFAAPAFADDAPASDFTVSGSATVASQYRFRGLSQSDNRPVVQGAITVAHSSGFYVSTWGSSATATDTPIDIGGTEIDVYGGFAHELFGTGVTADVGVYGYIYPGFKDANYVEVYGSLAKTYGPVTAKVGVYYAPAQKVFNLNFTSPTRNNTYVYGDLSAGIPGTPISLHGHLGHTGGGFDYGKQYLDYSAGAAVKWKNLTLDASIVGTNISKSDIVSNFGLVDACEGDTACIASGTTFFHRPAKTVGVVSLTASF